MIYSKIGGRLPAGSYRNPIKPPPPPLATKFASQGDALVRTDAKWNSCIIPYKSSLVLLVVTGKSYKNGYAGPSIATSLEPLAHCWNVARLGLFYRYHFGRCSSELAQLVPLPYSQRRSTCYSEWLHNFFSHIASLYNSLPI